MIDKYTAPYDKESLCSFPPREGYEIIPYVVLNDEDGLKELGIDAFPLFGSQDDIFDEIPQYVWEHNNARRFLEFLASVYSLKKNPLRSYTPIRAEKEASFIVLDWAFQDRRFSFYFNEDEQDKYSIVYYDDENQTFTNTVKALVPERYKDIAEEVVSYVS